MSGKEKLKSMLNNIVNDNNVEAQVDFHSYLKDKMHSAYKAGATAPKLEPRVEVDTNSDT